MPEVLSQSSAKDTFPALRFVTVLTWAISLAFVAVTIGFLAYVKAAPDLEFNLRDNGDGTLQLRLIKSSRVREIFSVSLYFGATPWEPEWSLTNYTTAKVDIGERRSRDVSTFGEVQLHEGDPLDVGRARRLPAVGQEFSVEALYTTNTVGVIGPWVTARERFVRTADGAVERLGREMRRWP
jgi:hypothetical protein